ncbi:MAG: glycosyltransferase [Bacteroidia bacterium]|nr:glycosyltransferase family 2 protein [Bacteroidia bacterium]MCZ2131232.1 glycosyltransferase [Bacteroidia bacterium]
MEIKKRVNSIKYPFWYLFKAPQRKLSKTALYLDLQGIAVYFFRFLSKKSPLKVSICVGISNRTQAFLEFFLPSLIALKNANQVELSLYDMGSVDFEKLESEIRNRWRGGLILNRTDDKFTRAKAFNKAVAQCSGDIVFLCDADMSLPPNLLNLIRKIIRPNIVWFPICFATAPANSSEKGKWLWYSAKGMVALMKSDFVQVGGLDEKYTDWGREDVDLWERCHQAGYVVIRQKLRGLVHHYHPPAEGATDYFAKS